MEKSVEVAERAERQSFIIGCLARSISHPRVPEEKKTRQKAEMEKQVRAFLRNISLLGGSVVHA